MKTKTIYLRAHPNGDWMSLGVSHIEKGSLKLPQGMELDAKDGSMRWKLDTPMDKRDFERRKLTFKYSIPEDVTPITTDKERLDALWEKQAGDSAKFDAIEAKRLEVTK
jgi:hypothetical protein